MTPSQQIKFNIINVDSSCESQCEETQHNEKSRPAEECQETKTGITDQTDSTAKPKENDDSAI